MNPRVVAVDALDGHVLKLTFTNGETGLYSCAHLLDFGVFRELKAPHYFKRGAVCDGAVAWPHAQDICPDTLYLDSRRVEGNGSTPG
ncbi:MAG: DUF2442 domain-containing protein [Candidatus Limnocylindrus sp.]